VASSWFLLFSYHNDAQSNKHLFQSSKLCSDWNITTCYMRPSLFWYVNHYQHVKASTILQHKPEIPQLATHFDSFWSISSKFSYLNQKHKNMQRQSTLGSKVLIMYSNLILRWPCIVICSYNQLDALISQIYFGIKLHMFWTVPLSIIRSLALYTEPWYMLYIHPDPARKLSAIPVWHIPLLCAQC